MRGCKILAMIYLHGWKFNLSNILNLRYSNFKTCGKTSKMYYFNTQMIDCVLIIWKLIKEAIIIFLIQNFEADFLWKVSLKILNSGLFMNTSIHVSEAVTYIRIRHSLKAKILNSGLFMKTSTHVSEAVTYIRILSVWGFHYSQILANICFCSAISIPHLKVHFHTIIMQYAII